LKKAESFVCPLLGASAVDVDLIFEADDDDPSVLPFISNLRGLIWRCDGGALPVDMPLPLLLQVTGLDLADGGGLKGDDSGELVRSISSSWAVLAEVADLGAEDGGGGGGGGGGRGVATDDGRPLPFPVAP